jgi:hypothetical protein
VRIDPKLFSFTASGRSNNLPSDITMEPLSKSSVFPTEIIELIIDYLQDDIFALTRISGTSHAILHSCRQRLFRSVRLGISPISHTFIRLFRYNPSIGQYVRELALHVDNSLSKWYPGKNWQNDDTEDIETLTQTPFVEKLSIYGGISQPTSWNSLHVTLQQPILDRIHHSSLTELSICKFVIPVTIFRLCLNLSALTLKQVEDSETSEPIDQAKISPRSLQPITIPQLRSLELGISANEFALALFHHRDGDGHPLIRLDGLKTLIVHCYRERETQVIKGICEEAIGLETFSCRGITGSAFPSLAQWPDFSHFSTVKTLKGRCGHALVTEDLLLGLCDKLQMFPQPNVLETLDIEISVNWDHRLISTRNEWGRLDDVLSRGFPRLHRVSIRVVFPYYIGNPDPESAWLRKEVGVVRKMFPWLNENAAVKFNFSTSLASH